MNLPPQPSSVNCSHSVAGPGVVVGPSVGLIVVGPSVGLAVVGASVGLAVVGASVGLVEGSVGTSVGLAVVGTSVGLTVVGASVGLTVVSTAKASDASRRTDKVITSLNILDRMKHGRLQTDFYT